MILDASDFWEPSWHAWDHRSAWRGRNGGGLSRPRFTEHPGPGETILDSNGGGSDPAWSRDGRETEYVRRDNIMRAAVSDRSTIVLGKSAKLFQAHFWHSPIAGPHFYTAADVKSFLVVDSAPEPGTIQAHVALNRTNWINQ